MNDDELKNMFASARSEPRETSRLEYGFETRLTARLRAEKEAPWFAGAWQLCPWFAAIMIAAGLWMNRVFVDFPVEKTATLSDDAEMVEFLTGEDI